MAREGEKEAEGGLESSFKMSCIQGAEAALALPSAPQNGTGEEREGRAAVSERMGRLLILPPPMYCKAEEGFLTAISTLLGREGDQKN